MASEFPGEKSRVRSVASGCPASKGNSSSAGLLVNFNHKKVLGHVSIKLHRLSESAWRAGSGGWRPLIYTIKWMVIN